MSGKWLITSRLKNMLQQVKIARTFLLVSRGSTGPFDFCLLGYDGGAPRLIKVSFAGILNLSLLLAAIFMKYGPRRVETCSIYRLTSIAQG